MAEARKEWDEIGIEVRGHDVAELIIHAQSSERVSELLAMDKEFRDGKWSDSNYQYLKERFRGNTELTDRYIRACREHEMTRLYMVAAANPHTSAKDLQYILEQTAKTKNDVDRADVVSSAFRNPNLKPEHYDALIDCFKDGPNITMYEGSRVMKLEGISLEQVKRFGQILNQNIEKHELDDSDSVIQLKAEVSKKKIELQSGKQKAETKSEKKVTTLQKPAIDKGPDLEL